MENFHNLSKLKFSPTNPKVFTEKGLYMLATILKSKKATETTLLIIETFSKIKKLQNDFNMILEECLNISIGKNLKINENIIEYIKNEK